MKVNVLQADNARFAKFSWWSYWVDVAVFSYGGRGYLLQMKVSKMNAKKFKAVPFKSTTNLAHADIGQVGDLVQMEGLK